MVRSLRAAALALTLVLASACGGGSTTSPTPAPGGGGTPTPTPSPQPSGAQISIVVDSNCNGKTGPVRVKIDDVIVGAVSPGGQNTQPATVGKHLVGGESADGKATWNGVQIDVAANSTTSHTLLCPFGATGTSVTVVFAPNCVGKFATARVMIDNSLAGTPSPSQTATLAVVPDANGTHMAGVWVTTDRAERSWGPTYLPIRNNFTYPLGCS